MTEKVEKKILTISQESSDPSLNICLDTLTKGKQALVFCNTKKGAESQAERIAHAVETNNPVLTELSEEILHVVPSPTKQCKRLALCVRKGIAFHHAGLHAKQRELVENKFREGVIKIICSTPTLAMGLDLPAFRVVIRDLKRFGDSGAWGMNDIPVLEYHQMCVPGETLVKTEKGDSPIAEIRVRDKVLTFDPVRKQYASRPVLKTYQRRVNRILELTTTYGYSLRLTENHPVWIRRGGKEAWTAAVNVKKGDGVLMSSLPITRGRTDILFSTLVPEIGTYVPCAGAFIREVKEKKGWSDRDVADYLGMQKKNIFAYKYDRKALAFKKVRLLATLLGLGEQHLSKRLSALKTRYGSRLTLPLFVDEDFLWLTGLIATDGTLTSTKDRRHGTRCVKVRVCNKDERIAARAKKILERLAGTVYENKRADSLIELEKGCTLLADILRDHFGIPHNAKSSSVETPSFLAHASPKLIGAYLAGVFDGDGSYRKPERMLFATGSKRFAEQIQQLLLRIGIISALRRERGGKEFILKGKRVLFSSDSYTVTFHRRAFMRKFARVAPVTKAVIETEFSRYHNLDKHHDTGLECLFIPVDDVRPLKKSMMVFNLCVAGENTYLANSFLVHNCGRAGRPGKESYGEAIILAETEEQKERRTEQYILGEPEEIYSKLAVEPVLRTYVLSLIASEFVTSTKGLYEFFERTFYAKQYGDTQKLRGILDKMVSLLEEWEFLVVHEEGSVRDVIKQNAPVRGASLFTSAKDLLKRKDGELKATLLGKRVAELYLDPYTGHFLMTCLQRATSKSPQDFALLQMLTSCLELRPLLRPRVKELDEIVEKTNQYLSLLLVPEPVQYSSDYEDFLMTLKTALFLNDWIEEVQEDELLEQYGVGPGEVHVKLDKADWLLYASEELARILSLHQLRAPLGKMRMRLKHGAKEELLPLLQLKNIGRVRARKLHNAGIRTLGDVRDADASAIVALLGKNIALDLKKQVGQDLSPEHVKVKPNKRKGQMSMADY